MSEKVLSVFIDESGDFGPYEPHSPYYTVAMILHGQGTDISDRIKGMEDYMHSIAYPNHAIHTGSLIPIPQKIKEMDMLTMRITYGSHW